MANGRTELRGGGAQAGAVPPAPLPRLKYPPAPGASGNNPSLRPLSVGAQLSRPHVGLGHAAPPDRSWEPAPHESSSDPPGQVRCVPSARPAHGNGRGSDRKPQGRRPGPWGAGATCPALRVVTETSGVDSGHILRQTTRAMGAPGSSWGAHRPQASEVRDVENQRPRAEIPADAARGSGGGSHPSISGRPLMGKVTG